MARKIWVRDPHSGGKKIPENIKDRVRKRILAYAEKNYSGRYNKIGLRFRSQFCYIDAYIEPVVPEDYDANLFGGKSREERIEHLRGVPFYLCRMRYFGNEDRWSMAYYSYAHMKYEPCLFDNGTFFGTPEEAFNDSAIY